MRVRINLINGAVLNGKIVGPETESLGEDALPWILNDDRKFIPFIQPSGREVQLLKNAIAWIANDGD